MSKIANTGTLGLHIIKNPAGTYGFAGSIPRSLCVKKPGNQDDVRVGRGFFEDGVIYTWRTPNFKTHEEARAYARENAKNVCEVD